MKLTIIQPSHYRSKSERSPCKIKKRRLIGLTLPYLAALTPPGWEVSLVDEQLAEIDFNAPVDLVAVTAWTINSLRAYEIADAFRQRGVPVIMGGPHTYFYPDESAATATRSASARGRRYGPRCSTTSPTDASRISIARLILEDLGNLPMPRYDLLDLSKYGFIKTYSVQASRGMSF